MRQILGSVQVLCHITPEKSCGPHKPFPGAQGAKDLTSCAVSGNGDPDVGKDGLASCDTPDACGCGCLSPPKHGHSLKIAKDI
jgi:hypothetical protein